MNETIEIDTDELTRIEIKGMLKENTGKALCDSGGAYGRHWEKNQERDFDTEPKLKVEPSYTRTESTSGHPPYKMENGVYFEEIDKELFKVDEVLFLINIYHFLCHNLESNADSDYLVKRYYQEYDDEDTPHLELMEDFINNHKPDIQDWCLENTYNFENALSQDIQFGIFDCIGPLSKSEKTFIIFQIHQGCDIRGGYTAPKIFEIMDFSHFMMGMTDVEAIEEQRPIDYSRSIFPKKELDKLKTRETRCWDSDDCGMSFYQDGSFNDEDETLVAALYHDDENDTYYLSDTLNTVHFNAKFEMYQ
jgi:hypothetical protein